MLIIRAVLFIRSSLRADSWLAKIGWKKGALAAVVIIGAVVTLVLLQRTRVDELPATSLKVVTVKTVAELSADTSPLSIIGQVSSVSEATVRAEKSGQVVRVSGTLGDTVTAGTIVAEIENASERAAVLSAVGLVEGAEANLGKVQGGVRPEQRAILEANVVNADAALTAARAGAVSAILSAHASINSAVRGTTDKMFTNPGFNGAVFNIVSTDSSLTTKAERMRDAITQYLARESSISSVLSIHSDLAQEVTTTQSEVREVRNFLDVVVDALNKGIPTPSISTTLLATYLAETTAARSSLTTTLSSLSVTAQGLVSAEAALSVARKNLEQGISGGQAEDVASARAALKQTQGGLAAARANLEKSIIRAPISGTINSFSLKRGDYVQMTTPVLTVANNGSLEVLAYVTENDARDITVGQRVTMDGATGVVTRLAPALDPLTKKIEVRISVSNARDLTNGQSVLVTIARASVGTSPTTARITIPISAVKVESERSVVFTLDNGVLTAHEVKLGALLGERVVISGGLTPDMRIVVDARGLREGENVEVSAEGGSSSGGT
ncbi:efflux RND transporter periplasmic adaptor subunit [Candidatus Kaiserbacteria bacterium]|nr:efflux RND transporter periplasmic adaptor subunit [Candidatus Kaiserbacteria bacterium]